MKKVKGFTLVEVLFAFAIFCMVCVPIYQIMVQMVVKSNHIDQIYTINEYERKLKLQFYPIDYVDLALEEILDD